VLAVKNARSAGPKIFLLKKKNQASLKSGRLRC
jgi:hypothetical protein